MKKFESLNNVKKTVLKLEKEINEITNNLSKVKNKEHIAMKRIINRINYLLIKDENEKMIYKEKVSEEREDNKKYKCINKNNELNENNYIYNKNSMDKDRYIDYLLLFKKNKINHNNGNDCPKKTYFNRKCISSSKINISGASGEIKNFTFYNMKTNIDKKDNNCNSNKNKNMDINLSNQIMNKANQIIYSKPRLMTESSKRNFNNTNIYKNNTFNTNSKKEIPIQNLKYLASNAKINNSCKHKEPSILNNLYYNYKDIAENNFQNNNYLKENNKNKITYSSEHTKIIKHQKDKILNNLYEKVNEYGFKRNTKLVLEEKFKSNHYIELNSNSLYNVNK